MRVVMLSIASGCVPLVLAIGLLASADSLRLVEFEEEDTPSRDWNEAPRQESEPNQSEGRQYEYSRNWFTSNIPVWNEVLGPLKGEPDLHYLEIGLFEGRSAIWMLENVLTHPSSRLTGIDIFERKGLKERYLSNLEKSGCADRATTITGYSNDVLRSLPSESFDIVYVDGSHMAHDVLADAVLSWSLLKTGGTLIFDDYGLRDDFPDELRPRLAIDAFITTNRSFLEVVHHGYQVILRKLGPPCPHRRDCIRLGKFVYQWRGKELVRGEDKEPVSISEAERELIKTIIRSREFGEVAFTLSEEILADPNYRELQQRLNLDL